MFRLASEFAFPGIVTKWRFKLQLFKAKSTNDSAWVAPYRKQLLELYETVNRSIAKCVSLSNKRDPSLSIIPIELVLQIEGTEKRSTR